MIPKLSNEPLPLSADGYLAPYRGVLEVRRNRFETLRQQLSGGSGSLAGFADAHEFFGLHRQSDGSWVFREYAPNASEIYLTGDFCRWEKRPEYQLRLLPGGNWEGIFPGETLVDGMHYGIFVVWPGGEGCRIPVYADCTVQDEQSKLFCAVVHEPEKPYQFCHPSPAPATPLIYECHVGMAQEEGKVGSFNEFREKTLPRIAAGNYNTIQLMAVMGHPYYGSFGYHVANFFSVATRFGTPEEFKMLVDEAHRLGLRVIIDLVHSHAVKNENEGPARIDGSRSTYFHEGERGEHRAWDSLCFNYGKKEVLRFLLSNCRYWLEEYHLDGFRFDGVTSMLYFHHGLNHCFTSYGEYFSDAVDEEAVTYLALANALIHELRPDALTVAEDVSGMPGLAAPQSSGGIGFDCRMAMGVTDYWFKLFDRPDRDWPMGGLFYELTNRRRDERSISYVECHDQAIVGGQTAIFRLADKSMYDAMHVNSNNPVIDRAIALHKMVRLATLASAGHGYLNFMGNEFGHPEWIDFPREGNQWSYAHARRQWSLAENPALRFHFLQNFDRAMLKLIGNDPEFFRSPVQLVKIDESAKIVVWERNDFYFFFNFHCENSVSDYPVEVRPFAYRTVLDSDAPEFGGFALRTPDQSYYACQKFSGTELSLYLPCRTVLVLKRENAEPKSGIVALNVHRTGTTEK